MEAAREAALVHVASVDDHELTDPEISDEPDLESTWPPHCLRGTRGAEKIVETKQLDPLPLPYLPLPHAVLGRVVEARWEIVIPKKRYDPFTNPNAEPLLVALDPDEILLFGVATDICDDVTVRALLGRGCRVKREPPPARPRGGAREFASRRPKRLPLLSAKGLRGRCR